MQEEFNTLRNKAVISAIGLACAGGVMCLSPNGIIKTLGNWLALASIGSLATSQTLVDSGEKIAQKYLKASYDKRDSLKTEIQGLKSANEKLALKLQATGNVLDQVAADLIEAKNTIESLASSKLNLEQLNRQLQSSLSQLEEQARRDKERIEYLESEVEEWDTTFKSKVEEESERKFKTARATEIQKIFDEHDSITREAMQLFRELQAWGQKVASGHQSKREIITSMASQYNANLEELSTAVDRERESYLEQIELLNMRVAQLQHELAGDLLEPQYGDFGFSENGKIANAIAYDIWHTYKVPLVVHGYEESDETVTVGYGYSKSLNTDEFVNLLKRESDAIAKRLGIYSISDIHKQAISPTIALKFRLQRPRPLKDDEIYRILEKADNFAQIVRRYHNHRTGGKPTLRLMSGTGGGKSLIAKILIDSYLKHEDGFEVWLSDPMDGSEEDYWQCPKAATDKNSARALFKLFADEFDLRASKQSNYPDVKVLGVFDEFDKQHSESDKERVKKIWTAIRHHNQRLILMGQSSEVGTNHWTWDEMKNCTLLFIGDAIDTAIKHFKDIGWDVKTKNLIQQHYKSINEWMDAKNESLSADKRYRVALLVCGQTWKLLEVPPAIIGELQNSKSSVVSRPWQSVAGEPRTIKTTTCPKCRSTNIGSKGSHYHRCRDCSKTWKK